MEFYDVVEERRSAKRYKDLAVEEEKLYRILKSITLAPSWSCKHCWKIIMVDDGELKKRITECINETHPAREGFLEAPLSAVICADPVNTEEIDGREYYMADCGIVMEHFMLSACSEGLSACWIGLFDEDKLKSIFGIPENIRIVALSPLGYRDDKPQLRGEKSIKDITYHNKWDNEMVFK